MQGAGLRDPRLGRERPHGSCRALLGPVPRKPSARLEATPKPHPGHAQRPPGRRRRRAPVSPPVPSLGLASSGAGQVSEPVFLPGDPAGITGYCTDVAAVPVRGSGPRAGAAEAARRCGECWAPAAARPMRGRGQPLSFRHRQIVTGSRSPGRSRGHGGGGPRPHGAHGPVRSRQRLARRSRGHSHV